MAERTDTATAAVDEPTAAPLIRRCEHTPPCPPRTAPDHLAAQVVSLVAIQGWALLCNGDVVFSDGGCI